MSTEAKSKSSWCILDIETNTFMLASGSLEDAHTIAQYMGYIAYVILPFIKHENARMTSYKVWNHLDASCDDEEFMKDMRRGIKIIAKNHAQERAEEALLMFAEEAQAQLAAKRKRRPQRQF